MKSLSVTHKIPTGQLMDHATTYKTLFLEKPLPHNLAFFRTLTITVSHTLHTVSWLLGSAGLYWANSVFRVINIRWNDYFKVIDTPRTISSDRRHYLPSARSVSNTVLAGSTTISIKFSAFLPTLGQFIDHDVISTPAMTGKVTSICIKKANNFG